MQHEIKNAGLLLNEQGNLREPGYAKRLLPVYRRSDIRAGRLRIKEWDYYLVANARYGVALTVSDNSYMGLDSVSLLRFDKQRETTKSPMQFLTLGKKSLPSSSMAGDIYSAGKHHEIRFSHVGADRILEFRMEDFEEGRPIEGRIVLTREPEESMVIATPFDKPAHFYFNQKINCMRAEGRVKLGEEEFPFDPADSFAVLDWGRGVWTYRNTWYWGSASGDADGALFGFNIGYGFGNTSAATENMLFYNGKAHKLGDVCFHIPSAPDGKDDFLSPWKFSSDDGRFEMDFVPLLDRAARTSLFVIESDQHQVFGYFTGSAVLDDGRVVKIKDFLGFAEKVKNKW